MDQLLGMRVFARVAEFGSFARAADAMDLSRAMVSAHVAQLEKHLGTRLLHRTTRKVAVSPEGAVYLAHCQRILAEVSAADDEMRLARDRPQGRLRVDVPVAFGKYLLTPALSRFTQRYPQVAIEVRYNDRFVDLAAEGVDVAVRAGTMFGFLNVFLAAAFMQHGMGSADAVRLLEERAPEAIIFSADAVEWQGHRLDRSAIAAARASGIVAFGSCSFTEPVGELRAFLTPQHGTVS